MRNSSSLETQNSGFADKDSIYRTHDIYCRTFDTKVVLRDGQRSETNCRGLIFLKFNQKGSSQIMYEESEVDNTKYYLLDCGHIFKAKKGTVHPVSKSVPCMRCGGKMAYWSHAHEWCHIIFRSNPFMYNTFSKKYQEKLKADGYDIRVGELDEFLHMFINAFDDIRVNSLQEHVYAGAAHETWIKWRKICESDNRINEDFIAFIFGVGLEADNLDYKDGPFSVLIPEIKEATDKIRLKGPANMLTVVRWALDRCVKKLLKERPPKQDGQQGDQQQQAGGSNDQQDQQQDQSDQGTQGASDPGPSGPSDPGQQAGNGAGANPQSNSGGTGTDPSSGQQAHNPAQSGSAASAGPPAATGADRASPAQSQLLKWLARDPQPFQADEDHHKPSMTERDPASQSTNAAVHKALSADVSTDQSTDASIQKGQVDQDVQAAVAKLQSVSNPMNTSNFLLSQAKSNLVLVDVKPSDIEQDSTVDINAQDKQAISRMRAAFARAMGRERYKMDTNGSEIDVSSVIQYLMDPTDDEMFTLETIQKGFAYRILGDMSGSMNGKPFDTVCRAHEMLKAALDYPFVQGDFWGFRGAEIDYMTNRRRSYADQKSMIKAVTNNGEVWLYRYDSDCKGYIGTARGSNVSGRSRAVPVKCGGLTPMHSALHVSLKDLHTQVPAGMSKRMFLLTDGHPNQYKTSGKALNRTFLRGLVAKEIRTARQKGTQVYTFIIGDHISDEDATIMFGPPRYWRRASNKTIGQVLVEVVLSEFVKYLKSK